FLQPFLTLHPIRPLLLSTILLNPIPQNPLTQKKSIPKYTIICPTIAPFFLTILYFLLTYIAPSNQNLGQFKNAHQLLA
ncbi:branched-chain amino acid transport system II carrier protein, partial [Bacillus mycoides]|uniref:branched-chain amino acid transport system II carrier protein n=1 Tax=Bacillus mycoides TaxID=1405 RepID=UPI0016426B90